MKTRLLIILGIVLAVVISGAVYATNFENVDADNINKGMEKTEVWEPGPIDGGPVYIPEKLYDANENSKYATIEKSSVRYDVTNDQLKENFELMRNSKLGITTLAIDYDRNMLVIYSPDTTLDTKIQSVIGDFPYVLIYEQEHPLRSTNPDHSELGSSLNKQSIDDPLLEILSSD